MSRSKYTSLTYLSPKLFQPLGRIFLHQESLPRLPIPAISETTKKLIDSAKPLLTLDEIKDAVKLIEEFQTSAKPLQEILLKRSQDEINWLEEWWLQSAYLDYRLPVVIHSSPGLVCPRQNFQNASDQLLFTAKMISGILDYKVLIDNQNVPIDMMGGKPLCMYQYYQILSACRIPGKKRDRFVVYPPTESNPPRHIIVICNNSFFKLDIYKNDKPLSVNELYKQLTEIYTIAQSMNDPGVGILTTENRNSWGSLYDHMMQNPSNKRNLQIIEKAIFSLSLDKAVVEKNVDQFTLGLNQMNHGYGSKCNSSNRWFDKTLQLIVSQDGNVGLNYEHCAAEGPPIVSILDHALTYVHKKNQEAMEIDEKFDMEKMYEPLKFEIDNKIMDGIKKAENEIDTLINDLSMVGFRFNDFGKNGIKRIKVSPDAFIQLSFQLAYNKLYGKSCPTYESGSLRNFQHGRTETIRSCSEQSNNFCQAAINGKWSKDILKKLFMDAINAHKRYTEWAMTGQGIDRHLLGLKLTAIVNGSNIPALLMEPSITKTSYWKISSSQVASKTGCLLGFGPVVPDGYGLCYNPQNNYLSFSISTWNSSPDTNSNDFVDALKFALKYNYDLLSLSDDQLKSKL